MTFNMPKMTRKLGLAAGLLGAASWGEQTLAEQFIVKIKSNKSSFMENVANFSADLGLKIADSHRDGSLVLIDLDAKDPKKLAKRIGALLLRPDVQYAVPNIKMHSFETPDDPQLAQQWAIKKVNAETAWDSQVGSREVVVAVIDTGVNARHEDLRANIWTNSEEIPGNGIDDDGNGFVDDHHGWDFRDKDNNPDDETSSKNPGHGTHCAGIVGAVGDNGKGISGLSQRVSLMPIRFLGSDGSGDLMTAAKAIDYATNNGADVISASWGAAVSRANVGPILEAVERAGEKGIVFVAAAANDGKNNDTREVYPANAGFDNVISVAASGPDDEKPSWSNFGRAKVDIAAPGLDILSTLPGNQYKNLSGTSMATPLVAGAVAMLVNQAKENGRKLAANEIKAILQSSATKVQIETACDCRIDIASALKNVSNEQLTIVPNGLTLEADDTKVFYSIGGKEPFEYSSSDPAVASINNDGTLKAIADGDTVVTVTDAAGNKAVTSSIYVGQAGGGGGGGGGDCPFEGPLCDILCQIKPDLPWCN